MNILLGLWGLHCSRRSNRCEGVKTLNRVLSTPSLLAIQNGESFPGVFQGSCKFMHLGFLLVQETKAWQERHEMHVQGTAELLPDPGIQKHN